MFESFRPKRPIKGKKSRSEKEDKKRKQDEEGKEKKFDKKEAKGKPKDKKVKSYDDYKELKPKDDENKDEHWVEMVVKSSPPPPKESLDALKQKMRGIKSSARSLMGSWKLMTVKGNNVKLSTEGLQDDGSELQKFPTRAGYLQTGIAVESDHDHTLFARFPTGAVLPKYVIDPVYTRNRKIQTMDVATEAVTVPEKVEEVLEKVKEEGKGGEEPKQANDKEKEGSEGKESEEGVELIQQQQRDAGTGIPLNIYRIDPGAPTNVGSLRGASIPRRKAKQEFGYKIRAEKVDPMEMIRRWQGGRTQTIYKREEKSYDFDDFAFIKSKSKKPPESIPPSMISRRSKKTTEIPQDTRRPSVVSTKSKTTKLSERTASKRAASIPRSEDRIKSPVRKEPIVRKKEKLEKPIKADDLRSPKITKEKPKVTNEKPKTKKERPKSEPLATTRVSPIKTEIRPVSLPPPQTIKRSKSQHSIPTSHAGTEKAIERSTRKAEIVEPSPGTIHRLSVSKTKPTIGQLEAPQKATLVEPSPKQVALSPVATIKPTYSELETAQRATVIEEPSPTRVSLSPSRAIKPNYSQLETTQRATLIEPSPSQIALSPSPIMNVTYSQMQMPERATLVEFTPTEVTLSPARTMKPIHSRLETPHVAKLVEPSPTKLTLTPPVTIRPTYSQLEAPQKAELISTLSAPATEQSKKTKRKLITRTQILPQYKEVEPALSAHGGATHGICHCHPCMMCHVPCAIPFAYSFKYCSGIPCTYHRHQCASTCLRSTPCNCSHFHHNQCMSRCYHHHSGPHSCVHRYFGTTPRIVQKKSPSSKIESFAKDFSSRNINIE